MSEFYFSATTCSFYPTELNERYVAAGTWPSDAVGVSTDVYTEYTGLPPEGFIRGADSDGLPCWVENTPTADQILAWNTETYTKLLRACTDAAFPLQSAVTLGVATEEQKAALAELQQYAVDLMSVDLTANPAAFPELPASLT